MSTQSVALIVWLVVTPRMMKTFSQLVTLLVVDAAVRVYGPMLLGPDVDAPTVNTPGLTSTLSDELTVVESLSSSSAMGVKPVQSSER